MKKNQERRLHRKNAKIVKEGGTPMQLNRPVKPDTTRRCGHCGQMGHMSTSSLLLMAPSCRKELNTHFPQKLIANVPSGLNSTHPVRPSAQQGRQPVRLPHLICPTSDSTGDLRRLSGSPPSRPLLPRARQ
jgi:hypothetical protein